MTTGTSAHHLVPASEAMRRIMTERPVLQQFEGWDLNYERLKLPSGIAAATRDYNDLIRDFQSDATVLARWYHEIAIKRLPREVCALVGDAISATFSWPDASSIELASLLRADGLTLPDEVQSRIESAEAFTYLDVLESLTIAYRNGSNIACQNVVTKDDLSGPTWPFFLGLATDRLSSIRGVTDQSLMGVHPLITPEPGSSDHSFDGSTNKSAAAALNHDDDHILEQGKQLLERAEAVLYRGFGLHENRLHRNYLIPAALVDIYFQSLVLDSIDRRKQTISPLQQAMVDALIFAHHEEQRFFLPPAYLGPETGAVTRSGKGSAFATYMRRWNDPADMRGHFEHLPKPIIITPEDCAVSLAHLGTAVSSASEQLSHGRSRQGAALTSKIRRLLDIVAPEYVSIVVQPTRHDGWRSSVPSVVEEAATRLAGDSSCMLRIEGA